MCGIVGYVGNKIKSKEIIDKLKLLEYRGYDSAGLSYIEKNEIKTIKTLESIEKLNQKSNFSNVILHTRWATHGKVEIKNTHPFLSCDNKFSIVHNGIIENFKMIKDNLKKQNFSFCTDTDSEVIANLMMKNTNNSINNLSKKNIIKKQPSQNNNLIIENNNKKNNFAHINNNRNNNSKNKINNNSNNKNNVNQQNNFDFYDDNNFKIPKEDLKKIILKSLIKTCNELKGSYAICLQYKELENCIFLAKNKSPLYVSENICASDPICFDEKAFYTLNDSEFCILEIDKISFLDKNLKTIKKISQKISNIRFCTKKKYAHYMLKEICETPKILENLIAKYKLERPFEKISKNFSSIFLIGCGTAFHACQMGKEYFESISNIPCECMTASEFRYQKILFKKNTLFIFISQSGETADTLASLEKAKKERQYCLSITNVPYSTLSKKADYNLNIMAGPEIAVASTKAYSAQLLVLLMLAKHFSQKTEQDFYDELQDFVKNLKIPKIPTELIELVCNSNNVFFIGRLQDCITSFEASLKLQEIAYINTHPHQAGELKHGYLALIENGTPVFATITKKDIKEKTLNNVHEALSRNAKVIILSQFNLNIKEDKNIRIIKLKNNKEEFMPISSILFFQFFAYDVCIRKGFNPDKPRNLAKSVTVE